MLFDPDQFAGSRRLAVKQSAPSSCVAGCVFSTGSRAIEASKPSGCAGFRTKTPVSGRNFAEQRKTKISQGVLKSRFVSKCYGWAIRLLVGGASLSPHSLAQHSPHLRGSPIDTLRRAGAGAVNAVASAARPPGSTARSPGSDRSLIAPGNSKEFDWRKQVGRCPLFARSRPLIPQHETFKAYVSFEIVLVRFD